MSRPRTLIVIPPDDFFIGKILAAVARPFEPLPIDVLRFGPQPESIPGGMPMHRAVPKSTWPLGVREFALPTLDGFDDLLRGYDRIAVLSLHPGVVEIVTCLLDHHPSLPLSIICMDDEIDRHFIFHREKAGAPEREAELRAILLYPPAVELAFERVTRFFINPHPWEAMLRTGRTRDLTLIPWMPPLINRIPEIEGVVRQDDSYKVVLFVKPSVGLAEFQEVARRIAAGNAGRPVQIVTFRNDMPTQSAIEGLPVRCYPYPLDEVAYHRIIAACHGVVIVPRGGMSTIRDAIRYGLDAITPVPNLINHIALAADVGVTFTAIDDLRLDDPDGSIAERRDANRAALARYESAAISAFRREYGIDPP